MRETLQVVPLAGYPADVDRWRATRPTPAAGSGRCRTCAACPSTAHSRRAGLRGHARVCALPPRRARGGALLPDAPPAASGGDGRCSRCVKLISAVGEARGRWACGTCHHPGASPDIVSGLALVRRGVRPLERAMLPWSTAVLATIAASTRATVMACAVVVVLVRSVMVTCSARRAPECVPRRIRALKWRVVEAGVRDAGAGRAPSPS